MVVSPMTLVWLALALCCLSHFRLLISVGSFLSHQIHLSKVTFDHISPLIKILNDICCYY
jgi:hypothetical protein